jgi:hypothetical protein
MGHELPRSVMNVTLEVPAPNCKDCVRISPYGPILA